jgi:RHS repeat-associated protein
VITPIANQPLSIETPLEQLALIPTNDPRPSRFDGEAPIFVGEPVKVASIGSLIGILSQTVIAQVVHPKVYYYLTDHLGTPQKVIDNAGAVVWSGDYKPFGEVVNEVSTVDNHFRFPGQFYDQETGLHYNYHRYYQIRVGRYLTPDPIGLLDEINLFLYAKDDPINFTDSMGLTTLPDIWARIEFAAKPYVVGGGLVVTGGATMVAGASLAVTGFGSMPVTGPAGFFVGSVGVAVTGTGAIQFGLGLDVYADELRHKLGLPLWFDVIRDFELLQNIEQPPTVQQDIRKSPLKEVDCE